MWRSFERGAELGTAFRVGPHAWCANSAVHRTRIRVGANVVCRGILRRESFGDGEIVVGDDVYIGDDCILSAAMSIEISSGVLLGHGVQVFDNNSHPLDPALRAADWKAIRDGTPRAAIASAPVRIGADAWIGFGSSIMKGVSIGARAIVGAGSVVTRDIPESGVVAGNPARAVGPTTAGGD